MEQLSVKQKEEQWVAALLHTVDQLARIHHSARIASQGHLVQIPTTTPQINNTLSREQGCPKSSIHDLIIERF